MSQTSRPRHGLLIRPEAATDGPAIEQLLDLTFGARRHCKISYRYRVGLQPIAQLSLAATSGPDLVGSIRYWAIRIDLTAALLLGPLAVDPARRGTGIGRALVHRSLALAIDAGAGLVFLVGDPVYYHQFGFRRVPPAIDMPGEDASRLQWLGLRGATLPAGGGTLRPVPRRPAGSCAAPAQGQPQEAALCSGGQLVIAAAASPRTRGLPPRRARLKSEG